MSLFELYPLILFAFSIIFTIVLHIQKSHKLNLNEVKKTIRDEAEKAIKQVDQKVVETEEIVNIKKVEVEETCLKVNSRIQELKADSAELDQLRDALNTYRNMLAQLNVATDQTHSYIVQTNDDATKLQNLKQLIDNQETKTYEILRSFDIGVKEQKFQLQNLEAELQNQIETAINEIITTRDDSLVRISDQIEKYQSLFETCDQIQSKHDVILKELLKQQNVYETKLGNINKEFNERVKTLENDTKLNLENYLKEIELTANEKFSSIEKNEINVFEKYLEDKKEETFLSIDRVLQSSAKTINEYNNSVQKNSNIEDAIKNKKIAEDFIKVTDVDSPPVVEQPKEPVFKETVNVKNRRNSNLEKKLKKKNKKKESFTLVDILDLEPNLEKVIKKEQNNEKLDEFESLDVTGFDQIIEEPSDIEKISLNQLEKIESATNDQFESVTDIEIESSTENSKNSEFLENKDETVIFDNDEKGCQINKFNGTGFGTLLDSYGNNKKQINVSDDIKSEPKSFRPGSILEKLVESSEKSDEKEIDITSSDEEVEDSTQKRKYEEEKISKNTSFEPIGEEEEILLD